MLFGPRTFESVVPVGYRSSRAKLLARAYDVDGHACPECAGELRAVRPPASVQWIVEERILPLLDWSAGWSVVVAAGELISTDCGPGPGLDGCERSDSSGQGTAAPVADLG